LAKSSGHGTNKQLDEPRKRAFSLIKTVKTCRIVIATIGSLGDLHPCLALALELGRRGHRVTIASTEYYRGKVEKLGIEFHSLRPNWDPTDQELIRQCENLRRGPEILYRKLVLPGLRATYDDLISVAAAADLMIAGELVYAAPLVAEKLSLRWVSGILSPFSFFSSYDPSVLVNAPSLIHLRKIGWRVYRAGLNLGRLATWHWSNPVRHLRRELGLRTDCDPIFRDKYSPVLVLALFSRWLAQPQPDWPRQTFQPGFVYFDGQKAECAPSAELTSFLAAGDAPIVFTQGSIAVYNPGDFYKVSIEAAEQLGRRAVLLGANTVAKGPSSQVLVLPYVPYSQVFPHGAVNVHQGGSGTTGQALRAGRPMLVVPYGWDQPDNAARIERLGTGLHLARTNYSPDTATKALNRLLSEPHYALRAAQVGAAMKEENGEALACDAIETVLNAHNVPVSPGKSFR
jgi:rhamnosyltransferase subunit B